MNETRFGGIRPCQFCGKLVDITKEDTHECIDVLSHFNESFVRENCGQHVKGGIYHDCKDGALKEEEPIINNKRKSVLLEAERIVNGSRNADYGDSNVNLERIASIARAIGVDIDGRGICLVLMAVKLGRHMHKRRDENLVDLCGYAELLSRWENAHHD